MSHSGKAKSLFIYFTSVLVKTEVLLINKATAKTEKRHGNGIIENPSMQTNRVKVYLYRTRLGGVREGMV